MIIFKMTTETAVGILKLMTITIDTVSCSEQENCLNLLVFWIFTSLQQGWHKLYKYLNFECFLEKSLKI